MRPAAQISRRTVLATGLLLAAGCRHKAAHPKTPAVSPDFAALADAQATEASLIAACQAAGQVDEVGIHTVHLAALSGSVPTPSPTAAPADAIKPMLRTSATSLRQAAVAAVEGRHAAVFASIAASHEVFGRD